ncbi:MAG: hypothetical protein AAF401_17555, partial [Pseudomonadota bacterium]
EAVAAFVVPAPGGCDPDDVLTFCKPRLAKYKAPKRVEVIDEIPVTPYGKPDKKAIRARFWGDRDRAINEGRRVGRSSLCGVTPAARFGFIAFCELLRPRHRRKRWGAPRGYSRRERLD